MTLLTTACRNDYVGNGATSVYDFTYTVILATDLIVEVADTSSPPNVTTLVLNTDYSVAGLNQPAGGAITLINSGQAWLTSGNLINNYGISIRRVVSEIQNTDIRNQGAFYPETLEEAFDYVVMICQQLQEQLNRAVLVPANFTSAEFNPSLPESVVTAYAFLGVNSSGNGWTLTGPGSILGTQIQVVPTGTINGSNVTFSLPFSPLAAGGVLLFLDRGFLLQGTDYTISESTITMTVAPSSGQKLTAAYSH